MVTVRKSYHPFSPFSIVDQTTSCTINHRCQFANAKFGGQPEQRQDAPFGGPRAAFEGAAQPTTTRHYFFQQQQFGNRSICASQNANWKSQIDDRTCRRINQIGTERDDSSSRDDESDVGSVACEWSIPAGEPELTPELSDRAKWRASLENLLHTRAANFFGRAPDMNYNNNGGVQYDRSLFTAAVARTRGVRLPRTYASRFAPELVSRQSELQFPQHTNHSWVVR